MLKWLVTFATVSALGAILEAQSIYAEKSNDAWNQIFHCLFSRRVEARVSSHFPEGASFPPADARCFGTNLQVSAGVFERNENGDRAIDPLYPSFLSASGPRQILVAPQYSLLLGALQEALDEGRKRTAVARALMQADLWSAFDILYLREFSGEEATRLNPRKQVVLRMLARLIQQTALTPAEIKALPENYTLAARRLSLPELFKPESDWMEIQWLPDRLHDDASDYRRVTRVFIKPAARQRDKQKFLDALRDAGGVPAGLSGVALMTQLVLIDSRGALAPARLVSEIQVRSFARATEIRDCELSRKVFIGHPESGGLVEQNEREPAYRPIGGNDYGFASQVVCANKVEPTVVVTLRERCAFCHGDQLTDMMTFRMHALFPLQPVRQLDPLLNLVADQVLSRKVERPDWKALQLYWRADPQRPR
jgi:hypothetical protein